MKLLISRKSHFGIVENVFYSIRKWNNHSTSTFLNVSYTIDIILRDDFSCNYNIVSREIFSFVAGEFPGVCKKLAHASIQVQIIKFHLKLKIMYIIRGKHAFLV